MKSILKKAAGIAIAATLAFGMIGCSDPVVPAGPNYVVGDFILKDGTFLSKDTDLTVEQKQNVAAVIVRAAEKGKPALGVGVVHNSSGLAWCKESFNGYKTNIETLVGDKTSGYMDGRNSWDLLVDACEDLKNASEDTFETVAENYPAFNYCRLYGIKNGLTGELENGWYLPTVAELDAIYQNKTTVNASLEKAGRLLFDKEWLWSCCQSPSNDTLARALYIYNGQMSEFLKNNGTVYFYVCAVRAFN